jgi:hypothetical protein
MFANFLSFMLFKSLRFLYQNFTKVFQISKVQIPLRSIVIVSSFKGPLWGHYQTEGQSLPHFLIRQGLKNIKALFTSLFELAEMEFWPAFV